MEKKKDNINFGTKLLNHTNSSKNFSKEGKKFFLWIFLFAIFVVLPLSLFFISPGDCMPCVLILIFPQVFGIVLFFKIVGKIYSKYGFSLNFILRLLVLFFAVSGIIRLISIVVNFIPAVF